MAANTSAETAVVQSHLFFGIIQD